MDFDHLLVHGQEIKFDDSTDLLIHKFYLHVIVLVAPKVSSVYTFAVVLRKPSQLNG